MTKIYEALEQSGRKENRKLQHPHLPPSTLEDIKALTTPGLQIEQEMIELYQSLALFHADPLKRIIQFISSREEEGTSTVAREFAKVSVSIFGRSVLLLNFDRRTERITDGSNPMTDNYYKEVLDYDPPIIDDTTNQTKKAKLFTSTLSRDYLSTPEVFDPSDSDTFWSELKQKFDLILIDTPPISTCPKGLTISSRADGIIIVVEAEKTRWPVIASTKEKIEKNGGNILGIVLNKRRYYIPDFIYKRL